MLTTRTAATIGLLGVLFGTFGCGDFARDLRVEMIVSPTPAGSIVPQAAQTASGDLLLSWLEPLPVSGYNFRMAVRKNQSWSDIRTIASGADISMFSADLPGIAQMPDGALLAYWEVKEIQGGDRYATVIQISSSRDDGKTWSAPSRPYRDVAAGQHSFISAFPVGRQLGLVWLDAQQRQFTPAADGHDAARRGAIGLRYVAVDNRGEVTTDSFIDPITCECCPTSSAVTKRGPVVVYRGRQEPPNTSPADINGPEATVRDIEITRLENGKWTKPHRIYADNWIINACPDNGPAIDSNGDQVAVAWWTKAGGQPKVQVAFSSDAGDTFDRPLRVDREAGEGQVTIAWLPGQNAAVVGWIEDQKVWARWISRGGASGNPVMLGPSPHHSRLPKWVVSKDEIMAIWTAPGELRSVRTARLGTIPRAGILSKVENLAYSPAN